MDLETVKKAEDGNGIIVRLYEVNNSRTSVTLASDGTFSEAETDLLKTVEERKLEMTDHTVSFTIKPYEILTLRLQMKGFRTKRKLPDASVSIGKAAVGGSGKIHWHHLMILWEQEEYLGGQINDLKGFIDAGSGKESGWPDGDPVPWLEPLRW